MRSGWETVQLGEVCRALGGYAFKSERFCSSGNKVLRISNITDAGVYFGDSSAHVSDQDVLGLERFKLKSGDLVIALSGATTGKMCVFTGDEDIYVNQRVGLVRVTNTTIADQNFINQLLSQKKEQILLYAYGGAQPNISTNEIEELIVDLPPLPEQRKIAAILRTWDEAIEKLEKLALAKQQRLNHLTVLLFQYSEKHGKRKIFGDFLTESSVAGATGENAKKITVKLYGKGVFAKKERNVGSASTRYYVRRYGQLIYSKLDFLNGAFGIIPKVLDGYESTQDLPAFDISPSINPLWLLAYLTRESFYSSCVSLARGQRKARRINPSDFLEMPLKVPSKDAQDRIAETLAYARYDLEHTNQQKSLIQSQKRGLMQKLLTGEWRVQVNKEAA